LEQSNNNYVGLLSMYNKLHEKNEKKKKSGIHDYSLMNALLKKTDEVNLHSNFIYSMINPDSSHYYGNKFLKLFLESINEDDFIDIENAKVYKEKGKIDLLVEDGNHVLIIENKLRAVDQEHQFSRYIQYVYDKYMDKNTTINDKIHVIYLSEYKKIPSPERESILGFDELDDKSTELVWQGNNIELCNGANLSLPKDTRLRFNRVQHSVHLLQWVMESKEYLSNKTNSQSLIYAFDEYKLILDRLKDNKWRNIMTLDEYTLSMEDEKEQEKMYEFMCESNKTLNDYLSQKLWDTLDKTYGKSMQILKFTGHDEFKPFTVDSCKDWFHKKGESKKWKETGFMINDKYFFALGVDNISYGLVSNGWKANIKTNRKKLQTNQELNIFTLIENIKVKVKKDN